MTTNPPAFPTPQLTSMSAEDKRIAIAEACGCKRYARPWDSRVFLCKAAPANSWETTKKKVDKVNSDVPDYLNSLDACHEMEKALRPEYPGKMGEPTPWKTYFNELHEITGSIAASIHATAAQRADAFLLAINLATK